VQYLLDTVTVVRHFTGLGKLGRQAANILNHIEQREDTMMISIISLMEIMYLAEKNRIAIDLSQTLDLIDSSAHYLIIDLNRDVLKVAETLCFDELHDRLILATARWLDIPIISSDHKFTKIADIEVIWD
jgi:PIN domain nuclease of toxin-antitoxin system